jgi:hypothetical protein
MVLTHALILKLSEMCEIGSLTEFFEYLAPSATDCPSAVATIEIDTEDRIHIASAELIGTTNALAATEGTVPVVRLGVSGFEHLVDSLWRNLWPALRRTFAFRLSFGPNDVIEQPIPALVCTPEQLQARWTKHRIVNPDDETSVSEFARVLCGERDIKPIMALAGKLGVGVHTLRELGRLERLHTLLSEGESFDDLLAAIRLANGISSQPTLGASVKEDLIARFTALIPDVGCKQLLLMRNLALSGFANTQSLWSAVECLVRNLEFAPADDSDLMDLVAASVDKNVALPAWRAAVTDGLSASVHRDNPAIYKAIWRWAERSPAAFAAAIKALPSAIEQQLADEAPRNLEATSVSAVLSPLLSKRWLEAHGAVLAATLPPLDAAGQQLRVDKETNYYAGLRSALRCASPAQVLECALALKDERLVEISADFASAAPEILSNIRCEDITEQKVWRVAIDRNISLWSAPSNVINVRDNLMAQLAQGHLVDTGLLDALAQTPLADLNTTPQRAQLWSLLPASKLEQYLQATATGWLNAAANGTAMTPPETALERAILSSSSLRQVLEESSATVQARLLIVRALPSFPEKVFMDWLDNLLINVRILSPQDSEQLGMLVASRHWDLVAKYLSGRLGHRPDLMPGLRLCADLLNFYTCWMLGISKPTATEKWHAFEQEACELYPSGPDSGELWSRAGGKNSDLPGVTQNGASRWRTTFNSIRFGAGPTTRELLAVMCRDFPFNEKLRLYANDTDIVGWR